MIPEAVFLFPILCEGHPSSLRLRFFFLLLALPVLFLPVYEILVVVLAEVRRVVVHLVGVPQHLLDILRRVAALLVVVQAKIHEPDLRVVDQVALQRHGRTAAQGYPVCRKLLAAI